jgi:PAS domain S-box-containing protein
MSTSPRLSAPIVSGVGDARVPVLLVDDRADDLITLEAILGTLDIEPVHARSGSAALRQLLARDFALILLDVNMPDMNGFEVAQIIKSRDRSKETPILFLTAATSDMTFIYRAYSAGAVDFLQKPIDRDVVRAKVSVFVELFKRSEALRAAEARERERQLAELAQSSHRRYRNLAEAVPQIVWTAAKNGAVTSYNRRFAEVTGIDDTPPSWTTAVHPDDVARCEREWAAFVAVARGDASARYEGECRVRTRDGSWRWFLARAVPDVDKDGNVAGFIGTHADFHDLRLALESAEAARKHAAFLAEASELLATSLDYPATLGRVAKLPVPRLSDWCIVEVTNPGGDGELAVAHVEPDKEAALKRLHARHRKPFEPSDADDADKSAMAELMASSTLSVPLVVRDRTIGAMTFGSSRLGFGDAERRMATDLARHASLAVDNARLYLSAQQALHARDEFLSIAAHELRTPLTTLQLQLQSLHRKAIQQSSDDVARHKLDSAVRQVLKLGGLTERLLDVSRIVAGRLVLDLEELDLAELLRDLVERFTPEATQAGCALETEIEGNARGRWDRLRIEQILTNLLSNAFKYGRGKPVQVKLEHGPAAAWIKVQDHGIGIATQDLSRIFERFERAVTARHYGGLGIGLYVARQIVEAHGGKIHVESEPGVGSAFTVQLPMSSVQGEG